MRRLLLGLGLLAGAAIALFVAASRSATVEGWLTARLQHALAAAFAGEVRLGRVTGTLGRTLVVNDLRVVAAGRTVLRVPRIEVRYVPLALLRGEVRFDRVTLVAPRVVLARDAAGWHGPAFRPGGDGAGPRVDIVVRQLLVRDGRVAVAFLDTTPPRRLAATRLDLAGALGLRGGTLALDVTRLTALPRGVAVTPLVGEGRLTLETGTVQVAGLRLRTARSAVSGGATVRPGVSLATSLTLAPLAAAELRALLPTLPLRTDVRAHLHMHGPWRATIGSLRADLGPAGRLLLATRLDLGGRPVAHRSRARFHALDPAAAVAGLPPARLEGHATLEGQGVPGAGAAAWALALATSEVAGQPIDRLTAAGRSRRDVHRLHASVEAAPGTLALRARAAAGASLVYRLAGRADVRHVERLLPGLTGSLRARLAAEGSGLTVADRRVAVQATIERAVLRGVHVRAGAVAARVEGARVEDVRLALEGSAGRMQAGGRADLAPLALEARLLVETDLRALGTDLGAALGGRVRAEGTVRGPLHALAAAATIEGEQLAAGAVTAERVRVDADAEGLGGEAPRGTARLEGRGVAAGLPRPQDVSARLAWTRAAGVDRGTLAAQAHDAEGLGAAVDVTLERTEGATRGTLAALELSFPATAPWQLVAPAPFVLDDGIRTPGLVLAAGAGQVRVAGTLALRGANDLTVTGDGVPVAPFCAAAALAECGGFFTIRGALRGTAAAPEVDASLHLARLTLGGTEYGTLAVDARSAARSLVLHAELAHPAAGALALDGSVPVDLAWAGPRPDLTGAPLTLRLQAARLDLAFLRSLAPGAVRRTAGRFAVDLQVTGTREVPRVEGEITLSEGRVEVVAAGAPWEDVRARITASGTALVVTELAARGGEGTLAGRGTIALGQPVPGALDLSLALDEFLAVRRPDYEGAVSGTLALRGTVRAPELTGRLDVDRAVIRPTGLQATGSDPEPDPTIAVLSAEEPLGPPPPPASGPPILDALRLQVEVVIAGDAWVRRRDASIALGGRLRVDREPRAPVRLTGEIRLLHGWYAFQGRRFDIDQGVIRFTGAAPPEPVFDVTALYRTPEYRIVVRVEGAGERPHLFFSSDPPLAQADILSVILFGKPAADLGRAQSAGLQQQAVAIAAGYAVPELRTSLMDTFGVDLFEIEAPEGTDRPGRVRVGRYVTRDVLVSLAQEFGPRTAGVVSVEYGLSPSISIRGSTSTRGTGAVDLFWHRRY